MAFVYSESRQGPYDLDLESHFKRKPGYSQTALEIDITETSWMNTVILGDKGIFSILHSQVAE